MSLAHSELSDEVSENILALTSLLSQTRDELSNQLKGLIIKTSQRNQREMNP